MNCSISERRIGFGETQAANREFQRYLGHATITTELPVDLGLPCPVQPKVEAVVQYMMQNLSKPVRVNTLSEMAQLSPSALFLLFKRTTGLTPIAFLIRARMKVAIQLLEETNLQVKQIAALVGYPDEFHFSRRFKSTIGIAPRFYRTKALLKEPSEFRNGRNPVLHEAVA